MRRTFKEICLHTSDFNPRTPCEVRRYQHLGRIICCYFNSRTPCGVRLYIASKTYLVPIIREILAGTKYRVQERPAEIPDGYSFQKYVYYDDYNPAGGTSPDATATYSGDNANAVATAGAPDDFDHGGTVYNEIATGKDPHVDVCNLKGYGLRVKKVWTDAD